MANHELTCEFCHHDQRTFGLDCCDRARAKRAEEKKAHIEKNEARKALLTKHGIAIRVMFMEGSRPEINAEPDSLFRFLESLEASALSSAMSLPSLPS